MALIGSSIDPRMFVQDYSGFQNAAAIRAAGMMNFGNQIGGAIKDYGEQQKEAKAGIAKGKAALEFAKTINPGLADKIDILAKQFQDPSKSQVELAAIGNQMGDHVAAMLGEQRFQQEFGLRKQEVESSIEERKSRPPAVGEFYGDGGVYQKQWDSDTKTWVAPSMGVDPSRLPTPLQPYTDAFNSIGTKYGIDPALLAAISIHETDNGKSSAFRNKNNAMGVSNSKGPIDTGTVEASIERMAKLLAAGQRGEGPYAGATTIEAIGSVYAPVGAENDPRGLNGSWASGVASALESLGAKGTPVGFKPDKTGEEWQDFERGGKLYQRNVLTKEVKQVERGSLVNVAPGSALGPEDLKKGYRENRDQNGNVTIDAIPDSPAFYEMEISKLELAKKKAEASGKSKDDYIMSAQDEQNNLVGGTQIRAVEDALNLLPDIPQGAGVIGGAKRAVEAALPSSTVKQLEAAIAPIKNTEFIGNLGKMRAASPTGGAVGQVSEQEGQRFEQLRASLDIVNQTPEQLRRNLLLFKEASLDYLHGTKAQREKLVKEGKITPEINAQIEALYPQATVGPDGKMQPRNPSGPTVDPEVLRRFPFLSTP